MLLRDKCLRLLNYTIFLIIWEILAFLWEMHLNWLEKPSVEQNNHSFLKWLGRGIADATAMLAATINLLSRLAPRQKVACAPPPMKYACPSRLCPKRRRAVKLKRSDTDSVPLSTSASVRPAVPLSVSCSVQFRWQKANSFHRSEKWISREWPRVDIGLSVTRVKKSVNALP